ncbi:CinA family protein [Cumulibacter soli]|uniref:CinA family protein n=1 Tax=Cumulibacter soli TaxID=2546344 RepID=UPI001ABB7C69|nr:CinA family protein [Cumulibacter soli]
MDELLAKASEVAAALRERGETIAVTEASSGGLISAALLGQAGASAYYVGGNVVYTKAALSNLLAITPSDMTGVRPLSEPHANLLASAVRDRLGTTWGIAEFGAAGPSGTRYGDPAGTTFLGVVGPVELTRTIETGSNDRVANMQAFAVAALELLNEALA